MQTHVHANERPSRFLTGRIEGFREVLSYFAALPPRQIAFLLQLEFWDWEIDQTLNAGGRVLPNLAKFRKQTTATTVPSPTA